MSRALSALLVLPCLLLLCAVSAFAQQTSEPLRPEWCRQLPRPGYRQLQRVPSPDPWFEVYRVSPGVFAIYEPHQYEEVISYLITGSKRALLFDTGMGIADLHKLVAQLTSLPIIALNSHTHADHIGDNWRFDNILALDTPYTRHNALGASHDLVEDEVLPQRFCGSLPPGFKPEAYVTRAFRITRFIKDGEVIDLGDRRLEVLHTPGHTPDALCLLDRKHRLLFTGDTFYPGPIYLFVPETNLADYAKSVDRLSHLAPSLDLLLTAHNFPTAKPEMLTRLADAMQQVQAGKAKFQANQGVREYRFDGFSVLLADK